MMHVMNPHVGPHSEEHAYLKFAAALLMVAGGFHLFFSIICMSMILFSPMMSFAGDGSLFSLLDFNRSDLLPALVYSYVIFLSFFGWVIGLLAMMASRYCLRTHSWRFVMRVVLLNWLWLPVGTTIGLILWRDLRRKAIKGLFDDVQQGAA